jgi:hypothetical protein
LTSEGERSLKEAVEILEVARSESAKSATDGVDSFSLERPAPGTGLAQAVEVQGWVLGRSEPVSAIELVHDDIVLLRAPVSLERPDVAANHPHAPAAGSSGFYVPVSTLNFPRDFEFAVCAVLPGDTRVELATVRGRRPPLRSSFEPGLQPLMVTTTGRTGSTALVQLLAAHPRVVAYRPFEYEPRVATYWTDLLRALSEPAGYGRQLSHARNLNNRWWWIGAQFPMPPPRVEDEVQRWIGHEQLESLTSFCQNSIEAVYERAATAAGVKSPLYFAEKYLPTVTPSLMWELYPSAREILLVRDFRDMVSSILAFDARRGFRRFERIDAESDEEYVLRIGHKWSRRLLESWTARKDRSHLVRYEDLVLRPADTLDALLAYLRLEGNDGARELMLEALATTTPQAEAHRTASSAQSSIGRWRVDLPPPLKRACEVAFGPALEAFGYQLESRVGT